MFKTMIKSALAVSLIAGGVIALAPAPASAKSVTITAGPGSNANCALTATAKLAPTLKSDWAASPGDSVPAVAALPATTFSAPSPVQTSAKGKGTCTGSATDGTNSTSITGIKKVTISTDPSHPGSGPATCGSLLGGSTALFNATIKWNATPNKVADTTVTGMALSVSLAPLGFGFSGGTVTGSFAGGTLTAVGAITVALVAEVTQPAETGAQAVAGSYTSLGCQPTLKVKTNGKGVTTATIKHPKGLKMIVVQPGSFVNISA